MYISQELPFGVVLSGEDPVRESAGASHPEEQLRLDHGFVNVDCNPTAAFIHGPLIDGIRLSAQEIL